MICTSFVILALTLASASGMPLTKRIAQTISESTTKWHDACKAAGGGDRCKPLAVDAFSTLLAAPGPCAQREAADKMVSLAKELQNNPDMIKFAQIFAQQPRNTPSSLSMPYCQEAPQNEELKGLFQCQFKGANPTKFVGDLAVGAPGTIPFGQTEPLEVPGSCPAHPDGPIDDGTQLVDITQEPCVENTSGAPPADGPAKEEPTQASNSTAADPTPFVAPPEEPGSDSSSNAPTPTLASALGAATPDAPPEASPEASSPEAPPEPDHTHECDHSSSSDSAPEPTPTQAEPPSTAPAPAPASGSPSESSGALEAPSACAAKQKRFLAPNALLVKRIAQPDLPAVAKSWQDLCLASGGDITSADQPCVKLAGLDGLNALLAGTDPCAQQNNADAMIDFAKSKGIKNKDALIANAITYRKHPRNALDIGGGLIPSTPYCTKAPRNSELVNVVNGQLDGVNPGIFGGPKFTPVAFGAPGTCPFGQTPDVNTCSCK
jgi:hypothetical protein